MFSVTDCYGSAKPLDFWRELCHYKGMKNTEALTAESLALLASLEAELTAHAALDRRESAEARRQARRDAKAEAELAFG